MTDIMTYCSEADVVMSHKISPQSRIMQPNPGGVPSKKETASDRVTVALAGSLANTSQCCDLT